MAHARTTAAWTLLLAVCVVSAVAGRLCYLGRPFDSDAAMFVYMGQLVADGGAVGRDLVDNKFPTVGLVTSAAWRAVGTSWPGYVLLGTGLSAVAATAIGEAAARGRGSRAAAVLFMVVFLNFTPAVFGGFQLETPIACFGCLAAMAAVRAIRDGSAGAVFVAALAAGCAALLKPTGVGVIGAMGVGLVARWWGRRDPGLRSTSDAGLAGAVGATAVGLAVPLGMAAAYLSAAGLWGEMPTTARRLSAYAHGSVFDAVSWIKLATVGALVGFPLVVRRRGTRSEPGRVGPGPAQPASRAAGTARLCGSDPAVVAFAWVWLAVEMAGVVAQRRMYAYHFLPTLPPAALVFGLLPRPARPLRLLVALGPAAALGIVCALHVIATPTDDRLAVGRYLTARAAAGDRVWADDWPRLLIETGLRPGSRQPLTFLFANDDGPTAAADSARIVADLDERRAGFVVLPADLDRWLARQTRGIVELAQRRRRAAAYVAGWRRIEAYTRDHYRREAVVGDMAVYRRAEPPPGLADGR